MSYQSELKIKYPPRNSGVTNKDLAQQLQQSFPGSFRLAQDVLVASGKCLKGGGLFSSAKSKRQALHRKILDLDYSLAKEGFDEAIEHAMGSEVVAQIPKQHRPELRIAQFLSFFALAFPNWPDEYDYLNSYMTSSLFPAS